ncbi:MAG TPA: Ig-like domain repeat protein, partial [Acidobacteriaceae bacterium]|nr:Ig-like domain repeat protein [Acidobacteriaceae bacterium]
LYPLAAQHPEAFHDVAVGSNKVPCVKGSPDCTQSTSNDNTNGQYVLGYDAGTRYDVASGLGSLDVNALVSSWDKIHFAPTTTDLSLSQTSFVHGTPVTAQVTVSAGGGTPTGQVALVTSASPVSNTGLGTLTLSGGSASASITSLPGGQYTVTARYGGDSTFAASESSPVDVNVTPEGSATTLSAHDWPFTSTGWGSGWQPIANGGSYVYGDFIGIDAQIAGAHGADGRATGTVTFSTAGMTSPALAVNSQGAAEWSPRNGFPAGSYSMTAAYSGDASYNASTAAPFTFTVARQTPLAGSDEGCGANRIEYGTATCLDSGIHVLLGQGVPPTGTLTYFLGNTTLGSAPLYCCDPPPPFPTPYLYLDGSIKVNNLPVGADTITVQYSGDANYNPLTFQAFTITVTPAANMSLSVTPQPVTNNTFTVTANVAGSAGQPAPTGTVQFTVNNGDLGSGNATIANASASYTFTIAPPPGTTSVSVSAYYRGDSNYAPVSMQTTVNIGQPFSLAPASPALTLASGGKAQTDVTVTPEGGFTGNVSLQCALFSAPVGASSSAPTCTVLPTSVTIAGTSPGSAVVSFATGTNVAEQSRPWLLPGGAGLLAFAAFFGMPGRRRRSWSAFFCVLLTLALFGGITACGISSPAPATHLTPGNYVYDVVGSSSQPSASGGQTPITEQTRVTVAVQ